MKFYIRLQPLAIIKYFQKEPNSVDHKTAVVEVTFYVFRVGILFPLVFVWKVRNNGLERHQNRAQQPSTKLGTTYKCTQTQKGSTE